MTERSDAPPQQLTLQQRVYIWIGMWRDSMPAEAVGQLQDSIGPLDTSPRSEIPTSRPASEHVEDVYLAVRIAAEGSDWKRDSGETLAAWVDRTLRPSARSCVAAPIDHRFTAEKLEHEAALQQGRNPLADVCITSQTYVALCRLASSAPSSTVALTAEDVVTALRELADGYAYIHGCKTELSVGGRTRRESIVAQELARLSTLAVSATAPSRDAKDAARWRWLASRINYRDETRTGSNPGPAEVTWHVRCWKHDSNDFVSDSITMTVDRGMAATDDTAKKA